MGDPRTAIWYQNASSTRWQLVRVGRGAVSVHCASRHGRRGGLSTKHELEARQTRNALRCVPFPLLRSCSPPLEVRLSVSSVHSLSVYFFPVYTRSNLLEHGGPWSSNFWRRQRHPLSTTLPTHNFPPSSANDAMGPGREGSDVAVIGYAWGG